MLSFSIKGEPNNFIKLTISKLFGFPVSTSPFGGYDTESILEIRSSNYSIKGIVWITTGNIYDFYTGLKQCQLKLAGIAKLTSYENNLILTSEYDQLGHVKIRGEFRENHGENNILYFEFYTDQTFINQTISELEKIYFEFGDNKGIKK